jgi:hypothetical protein
MRFVKLSDSEFCTLDDVRRFFFDEIQHRTPVGKFRIPKGHIARDRFRRGEPIVFTYNRRVVLTARAGSSLVPNDDEDQQRYPVFFVIDLTTLRDADVDLQNVQQWFNESTDACINLIGQGWNTLPDTDETANIWARLRDGRS